MKVLLFIGLKIVEVTAVIGLFVGIFWIGRLVLYICPFINIYAEAAAYIVAGSIFILAVIYGLCEFVKKNWEWAGDLHRKIKKN